MKVYKMAVNIGKAEELIRFVPAEDEKSAHHKIAQEYNSYKGSVIMSEHSPEEIEKALELHNTYSGAHCKNCPYKNCVECKTDMMLDALALIRYLAEKSERLKNIPEQLHKEMTERMAEEVKIERKLTVRKMQERLHEEFRMYGSKDKFNKEFFLSKTDEVANELLEKDLSHEGY